MTRLTLDESGVSLLVINDECSDEVTPLHENTKECLDDNDEMSHKSMRSCSRDGSHHSSKRSSNGIGNRCWSAFTNKHEDGIVDDDDDSPGCYPLKELKKMGFLAIPVIASYVLQTLLSIVGVMVIGRLNDNDAFDGAALGNMSLNVFGISVCVGLASAGDTLMSQANGSGNKPLVGVILQRSILVLAVACLLCTAVLLNIEGILRLVGQDPIVSERASLFVTILLPGLPAQFVYILLSKYLQAQGIVLPLILVGVIANIMNVVFLCSFVFWFGWGFTGAAAAICLSWYTLPILTLAAMWMFKLHHGTWSGWSYSSLHGWGEYSKLAIPGMAMVCVEWWSFEIAALVAGKLGKIQLATQSIVLLIATLLFMSPLGFSIAASIRIGNSLGANKPNTARMSSRVALISIIICATTLSCITFLARHSIGKIFNKDPEVIAMVARVVPIVAFFQIADSTQGVCSGILRGCGRQALGAIINCIGYYVIALPLMFILVYRAHLDIKGIWWGLSSGVFVQALAFVFFIYRTDWSRQAALAKERSCLEKVVPNLDLDELDFAIDDESSICSGEYDKNTDEAKIPLSRFLITESNNSFNGISDTTVTPKLLKLRALTIVIAFLVLVAGIIIRETVPLNHPTIDNSS